MSRLLKFNALDVILPGLNLFQVLRIFLAWSSSSFIFLFLFDEIINKCQDILKLGSPVVKLRLLIDAFV